MVWKDSKEMGIGKAVAANGKVFMVANYRPAGNMMSRYADNVFPPKTTMSKEDKKKEKTPMSSDDFSGTEVGS